MAATGRGYCTLPLSSGATPKTPATKPAAEEDADSILTEDLLNSYKQYIVSKSSGTARCLPHALVKCSLALSVAQSVACNVFFVWLLYKQAWFTGLCGRKGYKLHFPQSYFICYYTRAIDDNDSIVISIRHFENIM